MISEHRWSSQGEEKSRVLRRVKRAIAQTIEYGLPGYPLILSYPGDKPEECGLQAYEMVLPGHPNHILTHTRGKGEQGFSGTCTLEREAIYMLAELCGSQDPELEVDGYVTTGGTEANIAGMWIGRNYLHSVSENSDGHRTPSHPSHGKDDMCVLVSFAAHYSVRKACNILGTSEGEFHVCAVCKSQDPANSQSSSRSQHIFNADADGLRLVGMDESGAIHLDEFRQELNSSYEQGMRKFLVVATAGTAVTGAVDDVGKMAEILGEFRKRHPECRTYLHVDAAFGGFVLPFLEQPDDSWGFSVDDVQSVAIDPHKMGLTAYPIGGFLCRKDLQQHIQRVVPYVNEGQDDTVVGSRSGAAAVSLWATLRSIGTDGYRSIVQRCMANKSRLISELNATGIFDIVDSPVNAFGIMYKPEQNTTEDERRRVQHVDEMLGNQDRYKLSKVYYPSNPRHFNSCPRTLFKIVMMPHVDEDVINIFITDLLVAMNRARIEEQAAAN